MNRRQVLARLRTSSASSALTMLAGRLALAAPALGLLACSRSDQPRDLQVRSRVDGSIQDCAWQPGAAGNTVLVLELPTWSGHHLQGSALLPRCKRRGWAYLRPGVRAPNRSPQACLSALVLHDLDDAVAHVHQQFGPFSWTVLVGESGGGYTALGAWLRCSSRFSQVITWNPISDLASWYLQVQAQYPEFAADILNCTASSGTLNLAEAQRRSPLHWLSGAALPETLAPLEIYAGLRDGHAGPVPLSQALDFFERCCALRDEPGRRDIKPETRRRLLAADTSLLQDGPSVAGRRALQLAGCKRVSLTVFDGSHEHLADHTEMRIAATT